jgi:hypothetical protein
MLLRVLIDKQRAVRGESHRENMSNHSLKQKFKTPINRIREHADRNSVLSLWEPKVGISAQNTFFKVFKIFLKKGLTGDMSAHKLAPC